ncbi:MAG: tetratricopeptide repeat protein [Bacteroidales bacterium]|jgi:tetratricopeptide (TPR) repeat protein|nr:tetratricopeptide repeat protein [Bacteroidales bacterium]
MNIHKNNRIKTLILIAVIALSGELYAQKTHAYSSPDHEYKLAGELFVKEQYNSAKNMYGKVYAAIENKYDIRKQTSLYYMAVCATLLYHEDAEKLLLLFISDYPEHPHIQRLWFHLGNYYFEGHHYKDALNAYEKVDMKILQNEETVACMFKKGYAYFMQDNYAKAKPLLKDAASANSQYKNKALFYYSHILYIEQSYHAALAGFEQLRQAETYSEIVPFYIAHIYFATQRYEELVAQSEELIAKSSKKRLPEINRLIAQSYFHLQRYEQAANYFENYITTSSTLISCDDYYMTGYCYYIGKEYNKAISMLTKAVCKNDTSDQYVYFALGDAYLKSEQKEFAARAFFQAYSLKVNQLMTEDALFEYAKLQYELSTNPFVAAITAFEQYLNDYPQSKRKNEVESYLSTIYLTTKNYKAAISSIEKINNKSMVLMKAYQRVTYFRGLELFNDGIYDEAEKYLNLAIQNNFDALVYAQAIFWKAEIAYRQENYSASQKEYDLFLSLQQAKFTTEYPMAFYNGGYADFKLKQYKEGLHKFLEFQKLETLVSNKQLVSDACNRSGDCYFMLSELNNAKTQYDKVIQSGLYNVDYALYQRAQTEGGLRQFDEKIQTMQLLEKQYPKSPYVTEVQYEMGNTYFMRGENEKAIAAYKAFVVKNPHNPLTKTALLKLGSVYYNTEQDEKALEVFKTIIADYPNSEEASIALKNIENIYTSNGNVDEFFAYIRGVSFANITVSHQDSIMYNAATGKYFNKKFSEAEKDFEKYIDQFSEGVFIINVHYYLAECAFVQSDYDKALKHYEYVIQHRDEHFLNTSLLNAATILYDKKEYQKALSYYQSLEQEAILPTQKSEASRGVARCYYELKEYSSAIAVAEMLQKEEKAGNEIKEEATLIIARSALAMDNYELAKTQYTLLSKGNKSETASEALYNLTYIEYKKGNPETAEKKIFEILTNISHDYWLAKSYILLGDIYLEKGNSFQAKHTYLSIIENYDGEELVQIATEKYEKIIEKENAINKEQENNQNQNEENHEE